MDEISDPAAGKSSSHPALWFASGALFVALVAAFVAIAQAVGLPKAWSIALSLWPAHFASKRLLRLVTPLLGNLPSR